jgi:hypothetical protein
MASCLCFRRLARGLVVSLFYLLSNLLTFKTFVVGDEGLDSAHGQNISLIDLTEPSIEQDKELMNYLEHVSLCK